MSSHLDLHEVVQFDTHHGRVSTVAVYDRDLPVGAVIVQPKPFLTYTQDEYAHALAQYGQVEFGFAVVTKAMGEAGDRYSAHLNVRDIDTPDAEEGFFAYSYPTLMHRVVETDNPDLAALIVEGYRAGGVEATIDDVLVS